MKEEWADVFGFEGLYQVSTLGRFKVLKTKPGGGSAGRAQYAGIRHGDVYVTLLGDNGYKRRVHISVIILETFIGPKPMFGSMGVCHYNDNRSDNRLDNLSWGNHSKNKLDAVRNGVANIPVGERASKAKMTDDQVIEARQLRRKGWSVKALCKKYDLTNGPMSLLLRGLTFKHLN